MKEALPMSTLLFLCPLVLLLVVSSSVLGDVSDCLPSDRDVLLAFKAGVSDRGKALQTWSAAKSCCSWHGVTCNSAGRVTQLSIIASRIAVQTPDLIGSTLSNLTELEVLDLRNLIQSNDVTMLNLPSQFKSLKKLVTLSLIGDGLGGPIPAEWSEITTLRNLNLSLNPNINGSIPANLCKLQALQTFGLANLLISPGSLTGPIPSCFESLAQLTVIELSNNRLTGSLPTKLGNLVNLIALRLSNNLLVGTIPSSIGNLKQLQFLHLQGNSFTGLVPTSLGNLTNLKEVLLGDGEDDAGNLVGLNKGLLGSFPAGIGGKALRLLQIQGTSIGGPLPASLGLTSNKLREITLYNNAFMGSIPESLGALKKLVTLNLAANQFEGAIPSSLARAKSKLTTINLSQNRLTGQVPSSFSGLSLSTLDLSHNHLTGSIPSDLGNALFFGTLNLGNNELIGAVPPSLWNLTKLILSNNQLASLPAGHLPSDVNFHLQQLFLDSNEFSGQIPPWIFELEVTFFINLANNKFSSFPTINAGSVDASYFNVSHNLFTGPIPDALANLRGINSLDLSFNHFSGQIPANFTSGSTFFNNLVLSHNSLSGPLPNQIFASGFFNSLDVSHNQLSGPIPDIFPNLSSFLSSVDMSFNQLSGTIPPRLFTYSYYLKKIKLGHNQFTGPIPNLSQACQAGATNLDFVALNDNKFTGTLSGASWIKDCADKFTLFDISGNGISGPIPDLSSWTNLRVLSLARNKFTGVIPGFLFTSLPSLQVLDLSGNNLSGAIPFNNLSGLKSIINSTGVDLKPLKGGPYYEDGLVFGGVDFVVSFTLTLSTTAAIDLSHNALSGPLPGSVGWLAGLHVFDVSNNHLSGRLPPSLGQIKGLRVLDVSNNAFSGQIPASLLSLPASDFEGNAGLCGRPLAVSCR